MTREELIHMADASGLSYYGIGKNRERFIAHLQRFADIVAEGAAFAEREACAKVCEKQSEIYAVPVTSADYQQMWDECAEAIRSRGQA